MNPPNEKNYIFALHFRRALLVPIKHSGTKKPAMVTFKNPSAPTFFVYIVKITTMGQHFLKYGNFAKKLFTYIGTFLQVNAPIYIDAFMFYKVSSTYRYNETRQLIMLVNRLQNSTDADLAYYWASDIRFDTFGDNKFADNG